MDDHQEKPITHKGPWLQGQGTRILKEAEAKYKNKKKGYKRSGPCLVYFVQVSGHPLVKIGRTHVGIESRMSGLQAGNPFELLLLGVIPGLPSLEKELHHQFAALHHHLEWFRLETEILEFIKKYTFDLRKYESVIPNWWFSRLDCRYLETMKDDIRLILNGEYTRVTPFETQLHTNR